MLVNSKQSEALSQTPTEVVTFACWLPPSAVACVALVWDLSFFPDFYDIFTANFVIVVASGFVFVVIICLHWDRHALRARATRWLTADRALLCCNIPICMHMCVYLWCWCSASRWAALLIRAEVISSKMSLILYVTDMPWSWSFSSNSGSISNNTASVSVLSVDNVGAVFQSTWVEIATTTTIKFVASRQCRL